MRLNRQRPTNDPSADNADFIFASKNTVTGFAVPSHAESSTDWMFQGAWTALPVTVFFGTWYQQQKAQKRNVLSK
jgi:hypothetical protein